MAVETSLATGTGTRDCHVYRIYFRIVGQKNGFPYLFNFTRKDGHSFVSSNANAFCLNYRPRNFYPWGPNGAANYYF